MNYLKKKNLVILSILMLVALSVGLTGCGNNTNKETVEQNVNEVPSYNQEDNDNYDNNDIQKIIEESEALSIGRELYSKATQYYFGNIDYDTSKVIDEKYYNIMNVDQIKSDFTEQGFEKYIEKNDFVKKVNGVYYRLAADRGGDIYYLGNELQIVTKKEDEIVFKSVEKYIIDDEDLGRDESQITKIDRKENTFIIKKVDGIWKIEEFTLPC